MIRGNRTTRRRQTQSEDGGQHTHPPFNEATIRTTRGTPISDRRVAITPATLHPPCHPTSSCHPTTHDSHPLHHCEGGACAGYPTTRTTQTDTLTHTPHTRQRTVCDMTAVLVSTAVGWAERGLHHTLRRTSGSSTPPPFNTPHRQGGTPSTHHHHTVHVHTTNERS